ncbi:RNA-directed DNA polymerase, eukaryota, reverse transcriptase zinc-binding domain protein [Tanacetum coccineum]
MWILIELDDTKTKEKLLNHNGVGSWFTTIKQASNSFECEERIIWVEIEGLPIKAWTSNSFRKIASLWGEIVELGDSNSQPLSKDDQEVYSSDDDLQDKGATDKYGDKENIDLSDVERVSESSFPHANDLVYENSSNKNAGAGDSHSDDPLNVVNDQIHSLSSKLKERNMKDRVSPQNNMKGGSILDVMDELVTVGQTMGYNMEGLGNKTKKGPPVGFSGGEIVVMGDFNEVRYEHKRFGSIFNSHEAKAFNNFISLAGLTDLPLEGNRHSTFVYGGLGVSSFYASNRALLFKWVWRFLTQESSWWSCFIKVVHGNQGALDSCILSSRGSPWLDIIRHLFSLKSKGIDLMQFMRKKISYGESSSFWNDTWLDGRVLKSDYPRLLALESCKSISVAFKLNHPSLTHSFRRLPRGGAEEEQVSLLCPLKSARRLIDDTLLSKVDVPTRWVKVIPIKVNILAWRVCLDKIPIRLNLSLRGIDITSISCPLCNNAVESSSHIFFSCPLARQVRSKVMRWWELEDTSINDYGEWLNWLVNSRLPNHLKTLLEGICYIMRWLI